MLSRRFVAVVALEVIAVVAVVVFAMNQARGGVAAPLFGSVTAGTATPAAVAGPVSSRAPAAAAPSSPAGAASPTVPGGPDLWKALNQNVGDTGIGEQRLAGEIGNAIRDQVLHIIAGVEPH